MRQTGVNHSPGQICGWVGVSRAILRKTSQFKFHVSWNCLQSIHFHPLLSIQSTMQVLAVSALLLVFQRCDATIQFQIPYEVTLGSELKQPKIVVGLKGLERFLLTFGSLFICLLFQGYTDEGFLPSYNTFAVRSCLICTCCLHRHLYTTHDQPLQETAPDCEDDRSIEKWTDDRTRNRASILRTTIGINRPSIYGSKDIPPESIQERSQHNMW